jgi:hypothetical protein
MEIMAMILSFTNHQKTLSINIHANIYLMRVGFKSIANKTLASLTQERNKNEG